MTDCSSQTAAFINAKIKNKLLSLMAHCHSANLNLCLTVPTAALYTVIQCKTAVNTSSLGSFFQEKCLTVREDNVDGIMLVYGMTLEVMNLF